MLVTVMINHLRGLVSALEGNTVYAQHMHTYIPTYVTYIPTYAYIRRYTCTYMVAVASLIPRLFLLAWE